MGDLSGTRGVPRQKLDTLIYMDRVITVLLERMKIDQVDRCCHFRVIRVLFLRIRVDSR